MGLKIHFHKALRSYALRNVDSFHEYVLQSIIQATGRPVRMSHKKWRETKQQPSKTGHQISCCLVSLHFWCDILSGHPVHFLSLEAELLFLSWSALASLSGLTVSKLSAHSPRNDPREERGLLQPRHHHWPRRRLGPRPQHGSDQVLVARHEV